jgi:hypothetical protein
MPPTIQVGGVLIDDSPLITKLFGLETESCSGNWSVIKALDGFELDRKIHAAGWNFFFMAAEIRVRFFGAVRAKKIQNAVTRILRKVRPEHLNGLEVTGIVAKHFLGVPYTMVSAHSRHIQQSCRLDSAAARQRFQRDAEWARS